MENSVFGHIIQGSWIWSHPPLFEKTYVLIWLNVLFSLAALGLSCGTRNLPCSVWELVP